MMAFAVAGLGFGDEGKGTVVDALAEKYGAGLVVRYNGGAQAAHNVIRDGRHHTFAQFGSATLLGARTHLSRFMVVNPKTLRVESEVLGNVGVRHAHQLLSVDPGALVTTPYHILANRLREELRGKDAHGTTGMGVGETVEFASASARGGFSMHVQDLYDSRDYRKLLDDIRAIYIEWIEIRKIESSLVESFYDPAVFESAVGAYRWFSESVMMREDEELAGMMERAKVTVFEGAQGMLLDEEFGFHPHSTWSDCTFGNMDDLLDGIEVEQLKKIGVLRTYHTRHGAGPLPTELDSYTRLTEKDHNAQTNGYQGRFRAGPFDLVLARYAVKKIGALDGLALTHLDASVPEMTKDMAAYSSRYWIANEERGVNDLSELAPDEIAPLLNRAVPRYVNVTSENFPDHIAKELRVPLFLTSHGPTSADKEFFQ